MKEKDLQKPASGKNGPVCDDLAGDVFAAGMPLWKRLWLLFFTFAKIAALVVGGGLAILPVVEETFSKKYKLLSSEDLLDMAALVQTVPGIIAGNSAAFVGMKVAGYPGVIAAVAGVIFPSVTVIILIAAFFPGLKAENPYILGAFTGVKACITGLIIVTAVKIAVKTLKGAYEGISFAIFLIMMLFFKINAAWIILISIPVGFIYSWILLKRMEQNVPVKEKEAGGKEQ
ncbi:MAG: chromate transporter [Lentisphaeria bacterium]|nr:chromate transporter [Lentisphaeria bacterium]